MTKQKLEELKHPSALALNRKQESMLLWVLAAVQFTNILDFVIIMPLGPQFMRVFSVGPQEFGLIVSSYTFSAGVSGLIGAFFIDRFDRRAALLTLYAGFTIGTGLCAFAPSYLFLIGARLLAGSFGGVLASLIFATVGDVVPYERRGTAMGIIMSAFSVATVIGVPLGLYIAAHLGWHSTFLSLAGLSAVILFIGYKAIPSIKGHVAEGPHRTPKETIKLMLFNQNHLRAFAFMIVLMFAGFSVIPFISPYMVYNSGLKENELTYIYALGGLFTMFTSRTIGKLADRYGKQKLFTIIATLSTLPIVIITNISVAALWIILVWSTLFFILVSGRNVPALALITESVHPAHRGSFMSFMSSVQQWSAGLASFLAGLVIATTTGGALVHYEWVGAFAVVATLVCLLLVRRLHVVQHITESAQSPEVAGLQIE
jgi:predicted MFS family arabinose efflux permease